LFNPDKACTFFAIFFMQLWSDVMDLMTGVVFETPGAGVFTGFSN
jgi:hypothetical protein